MNNQDLKHLTLGKLQFSIGLKSFTNRQSWLTQTEILHSFKFGLRKLWLYICTVERMAIKFNWKIEF